jgi:putative DNA primase/helicase
MNPLQYGDNMKTKDAPSPTSKIIIKGEGRDEWRNRYFKLTVNNSNLDVPPFSMGQIVSNPDLIYTAMSNAGANIFSPSSKTQVLNLLQAIKRKKVSFKVVTRLGWNSGAIVRPNAVIGTPKRRLETSFGDLDTQVLAKYRVRGTLAEWQDKIAALSPGNSRLLFALSLAFTGPILKLVSGPRGGGFQLWGDKETGKTTAAMVAGSVWGCHNDAGTPDIGFAESWHTTANEVEVTALAHSDYLLILDETFEAGLSDREIAQLVLTVIMILSQQREKARNNSPPPRSWRCYFLSTSNFSLDALAQRGGVDLNDAHRSRLTEIPLPASGHGIYEDLHGFASGEALTDSLVPSCRRYFGSAGLEFQKRVVADYQADASGLKKWLQHRREKYRNALKVLTEKEGLTPLKRSTGRCATVYAAGALAIKYGILPGTKKEFVGGHFILSDRWSQGSQARAETGGEIGAYFSCVVEGQVNCLAAAAPA